MTGFARVTENVIYRLKDDFEIVVLAHNWWGDPCEQQKDFKMYPSSNRFQTAPFGEQRIREIVEREQPDIVFTINDMWIINEQYRQIQDLHKQGKFKFVGYAPMDSYGWIGCLADTANDWDAIISYTEFGAHEFVKGGIRKPIAVIPTALRPVSFIPWIGMNAAASLGWMKTYLLSSTAIETSSENGKTSQSRPLPNLQLVNRKHGCTYIWA